MNSRKCPKCKLVNYVTAESCDRCGTSLDAHTVEKKIGGSLIRRAMVLFAVCVLAIVGFYLSLIFSARKLDYEQRKTVERSIAIIENKGFSREAFILRYFTAFRSNDNWLNASVTKENAYAATNYPFEIVTLYPAFFERTSDDTVRASVLLHEAKHLQGSDEKEAYEFVWKNKTKLGWTYENYSNEESFNGVRARTREYVPELFTCQGNRANDCTEN